MVRCLFAILVFAWFAGFGLPSGAMAQEKGFIDVDPPRSIGPFLFEDGKGRVLDLKDFKGRYVLLNLWATSCAPCVAEMPALNQLSKKLDARKIVIVALAEDHDAHDVAPIFFKRHSIDHLSVYCDRTGRAPFVLDIRGLPTTILINPQGQEIARLEGPADWSKDSMVTLIKTRLAP